MFTDWTLTDPHYFYLRGVLYGFVASFFFGKFLWRLAANRKAHINYEPPLEPQGETLADMEAKFDGLVEGIEKAEEKELIRGCREEKNIDYKPKFLLLYQKLERFSTSLYKQGQNGNEWAKEEAEKLHELLAQLQGVGQEFLCWHWRSKVAGVVNGVNCQLCGLGPCKWPHEWNKKAVKTEGGEA